MLIVSNCSINAKFDSTYQNNLDASVRSAQVMVVVEVAVMVMEVDKAHDRSNISSGSRYGEHHVNSNFSTCNLNRIRHKHLSNKAMVAAADLLFYNDDRDDELEHVRVCSYCYA